MLLNLKVNTMMCDRVFAMRRDTVAGRRDNQDRITGGLYDMLSTSRFRLQLSHIRCACTVRRN
jgi:hypothetical protein